MAFVKNFQHDVFISYAHVDNSEDASDQHWITQFKRKLHATLSQRLGGSEDLAIFFADTSLNPNQQLDELLSAASNSALFLAIASPSYAVRDWTKKELDAFMATRPDLERLFAVECLPLDKGKTYPAPLQTHKRLQFWQLDKDSATPMPLSPANNAAKFNRLIHQLAMQIQQQLEKLAENQPDLPISDNNQQVTGLQEQRKTYVPNFRHDVLVSYAAEDESWSKKLSDYLQKQLKQKLATPDGFQITTTSEFSAINTAATLLVIASPAYYQQHQADLGQMDNVVKQKNVFLVEYEPCRHSGCLNGLTRHKFWVDDDSQGIISITEDAYFFMADKLATALAEQLKKSKEQQEYQQRLELERANQQTGIGLAPNSMVFLCGAPEDFDLIQTVKSKLKANKIGYVPIDYSPGLNIREDMQKKVENCDALLMVYARGNRKWVETNLLVCRKINKDLKAFAVHQDADNPELEVYFPNLHIYVCPPKQIETYLPDFIDALL